MKWRKGEWRRNHSNSGNCAYILQRRHHDVKATTIITAREWPRQSHRVVRAAVTPTQFTTRWSDMSHLPTKSGESPCGPRIDSGPGLCLFAGRRQVRSIHWNTKEVRGAKNGLDAAIDGARGR